MVTKRNDLVVVDSVTGLLKVCPWCVPAARVVALHKLYRCTDGICPECQDKLTAGAAARYRLRVTHPSGTAQIFTFTSAFTRGLAMITLAAQPVTLAPEDL